MRYFEVEERLADVSPDCLVLTAERAKALIDENTIGVCPILGSTFNGEYEDVQGKTGGREGGRGGRGACAWPFKRLGPDSGRAGIHF
jgi:hypothetical protein